jgi:hypothetical protein
LCLTKKGGNSGKKLMAVTDQNPVQVIEDAIVNLDHLPSDA